MQTSNPLCNVHSHSKYLLAFFGSTTQTEMQKGYPCSHHNPQSYVVKVVKAFSGTPLNEFFFRSENTVLIPELLIPELCWR